MAKHPEMITEPRKPLVYIAGPYTHPDPVDNTRQAIHVAEALMIDYDLAVIIPHLNLLWHFLQPAPLEMWHERDLDVVDHCDALIRIGGTSTGADAEVDYAKGRGIRVFSMDDPMFHSILRAWRDARG